MDNQRSLVKVGTMRLHFGIKAYYINRGELYLHRNGRWRRSINLGYGRHNGLYETRAEAKNIVKKYC